MSDSAQSSGWWLASDGRWYPPDQHPDVESAWQRFAEGPMPLDVGPLDLGPALTDDLPERPPLLPPGVAVPPPAAGPSSTIGPSAPPVEWPRYRHPELPQRAAEPDPQNRLIGLLLAVAAIVVVAASLLPWVTFDGGPVGGDSSGWFRGEGRATVAAGIVLAGCGGAIAGGARNLWVKALAITAAVFVVAVFAIDLVDINTEAEELVRQGTPVDLDQGYGLWMLGIAGIVAFVLTLVERTPFKR